MNTISKYHAKSVEDIKILVKTILNDIENLDKYYDKLKERSPIGWTVAHEMVRMGYFFDPEKYKDILLLEDYNECTVAHVMARFGYKFDEKKHKDIILKTQRRHNQSIAHIMASFFNHVFFDQEILTIRDCNDETVAHIMARNGYKFDEKSQREILKLENKHKTSVAAIMAEKGHIFDERDIELMKLLYCNNDTVAHIMAKKGYMFSDDNFEVLTLMNKNQEMVIEIMLKNGYQLKNYDVLFYDVEQKIYSIVDSERKTIKNKIACILASKGIFFEELDLDYYKLFDVKAGKYIAHWMVEYGKINEKILNKEILFLQNVEDKRTVLGEIALRGHYNFDEIKDKELLISIADSCDNTVAHLCIQGYEYRIRESFVMFYDCDILKLRNIYGSTVAHEIVANAPEGKLPEIYNYFKEKNLLFLVKETKLFNHKAENGRTVLHEFASRGFVPDDFDWYKNLDVYLKDYGCGYSVMYILSLKRPDLFVTNDKRHLKIPHELQRTILLNRNRDGITIAYNLVLYSKYVFDINDDKNLEYLTEKNNLMNVSVLQAMIKRNPKLITIYDIFQNRTLPFSEFIHCNSLDKCSVLGYVLSEMTKEQKLDLLLKIPENIELKDIVITKEDFYKIKVNHIGYSVAYILLKDFEESEILGFFAKNENFKKIFAEILTYDEKVYQQYLNNRFKIFWLIIKYLIKIKAKDILYALFLRKDKKFYIALFVFIYKLARARRKFYNKNKKYLQKICQFLKLSKMSNQELKNMYKFFRHHKIKTISDFRTVIIANLICLNNFLDEAQKFPEITNEIQIMKELKMMNNNIF